MPKQADLGQYQPALVPVAVEYSNDELVAEELVDVVPVDLDSDTYFEFTASSMFETWDDTVEEDSIVPETKHKLKPRTYQVADHGLRESVGKKYQAKAARLGFSILTEITQMQTFKVKLNHEKRVADLLTTTGNHLAGNVLTAGAGASPGKWTDQTNGDPFKDLTTIYDKLIGKGFGEVRIVFGQVAWRNFSLNKKVLGAFQFTSPTAILTPLQVEQALTAQGLRVKILVAAAQRHTGAPLVDEDSLSLSRIWGDNVVFSVQPKDGPGVRKPAGAYTFRQRTQGQTLAVYTYEQPEKGGHGSTWVQIAMDDVTKIVGKSFMGLITATT